MKVIEAINKKYGANSSFLMGEEGNDNFPAIPTGSLKLDIALGIGGIPRGRIVEAFGEESSGKTTLCQHITAEVQKMGGIVAYIDVENALDPNWLEICGVDIDKLIISQPDNGEQAIDILKMYVESKEIDLVILDSVAALSPRAEIEGEVGDSHVALTARLMSQAMRKLTAAIAESNTSVIFTNQFRKNIGISWGNPNVTTGGEALKYYASVRLDIRSGEQVKDKDIITGKKSKITVKKNKVSPPFKVAEIEIDFTEGMSQLSEVIELASDLGIIDKAGAGWFTLEDGQKVQGNANLKKLLRENLPLSVSIENRVREHYGLPIKVIE